MIYIENLNKFYDGFQALKDVSFTVNQGEIVGFLGPNGAGKTTTMKIITCFLKATSGRVEVMSYDVDKNPFEVRKNIGYLPEANPLYPDMFIDDFLTFIGRLRGLDEQYIAKRKKEVINICSLKEVLGKKIAELSKGYRQRVGFAQALLPDPPILILDEPTLGLDPNQVVGIRELIRSLGKNKTVLLSTHILREVEETCNRVIIINRGRVVADRKADELQTLFQEESRIKAVFSRVPEDIAKIKEIDGVKEYEKLNENEVILFIEKGKNPKNKIIRSSVENNWGIEELFTEKISLESVFHALTKNE